MEHKLVKDIRSCNGAEQFDLGGFTEEKINQLMKDCFSTPVDNVGCSITFVIGGGKLVRAKYDPKMQKFVTAALSAIGYEEDRGASKETPGKFKYQHDTAKNLLFMHVFPHAKPPKDAGVDGEEEINDDGSHSRDPAILVLQLTLDEFKRFMSKKGKTYTAKKRCFERFKEVSLVVETVENKMMNREEATAEEQSLYDKSVELTEKSKWLQKLMQKHVDLELSEHVAMFSVEEKKKIIDIITKKITKMKDQRDKVKGEEKKAAKMQLSITQTEEMLLKITKTDPSPGLPLTFKEKLIPLYQQLYKYETLEAKSSHTIEEMRILNNDLPPVRSDIEAFENMSAEVFEWEEELSERTSALKKQVYQSIKSKKSNKANNSGGGWQTGKSSGNRNTKKQVKGATNAFSALSMN